MIGQPREVYEMSALDTGGSPRNQEVDDPREGTKQDQQDMTRLGKVAELKRNFGFLPLYGFAVILGNTAPWSLMSIVFSLTNGGTAGAIYMFIIVAFFMFNVVLSMAELASVAPTAGGQYHWVSEFAPRKNQKFLSYCVGWYAVLGWQSSLVGTALAAAQLFQAAIILYNPSFTATGWLGTVITIGLTCLAVSINLFAYKKLPILEGLGIALYFAVFVTLLVVFWVMGDRGGVEVLTTFSSNGWHSIPGSCLVGVLAPVLVLIGSDAQAHLAEETMDAGRIVPRAMVATSVTNCIIGFIMLVTVMFVLGPDIDAIRDTPTGVPVVEVLLRTTGSVRVTSILTCLLGFLFVCCETNNVTTGSRQLWSFARDGGIPFHKYFAEVSETKETPVRATMFTLGYTCLLSLFNMASAVALSTLTSLSLTGLITSYEITVGTILHYRIRGERMPRSRFSLGPVWGFICNTIAFLFLTIVLVMMFFPTAPNPRLADMNWSVAMYGLVTMTLLGYYFTRGRYSYDGPVKIVLPRQAGELAPNVEALTNAGVGHAKAMCPRDEGTRRHNARWSRTLLYHSPNDSRV